MSDLTATTPIPAERAGRIRMIPAWPFAVAAVLGAFFLPLLWTALTVACLLVLLAVNDSSAVRRALRPGFLALGLFFALTSGLWLGTKDLDWYGVRVSSEGLLLGVRMFLRGVCIVAAVECLTGQCGPRSAGRFAARIGLGPLADAAGRALSVLPEFQERIGTIRDLRRARGGSWRVFPRALWVLGRDVVVAAVVMAENMSGDHADGEARRPHNSSGGESSPCASSDLVSERDPA